MDKQSNSVNADTLRGWLDRNEPVFILDVRSPDQREEWQIPGSHYLNAYKRLNEGDNSVLDEINIPENAKVVTVCAAGRTSQIAAKALREKGVEAYSLEGGMKAWGTAWNTAQKKFDEFEIVQVRRTGKGCLSYIITSGNEAGIIDASLPLEVYRQLLEKRKLSLKYALETHIHADHLSRSKQVADYFHVPLLLPVPNKVHFSFNAIEPDTVIAIGGVSLQVIPTPGHTVESVSFYIKNKALFTGDTLFADGVGRPDLKASSEESRTKAKLLYQSLQHLITFPDDVMIFPAHTNKPVLFNHQILANSVGEVKERVQFLRVGEEEFVRQILESVPPTPPNYLSIVEKNFTGNFTEAESVELEAGANRCAIS